MRYYPYLVVLYFNLWPLFWWLYILFEDWLKDIICQNHLHIKMLPFSLFVQIIEQNPNCRSEKVTSSLKRKIKYYHFSTLAILWICCQYPKAKESVNYLMCSQADVHILPKWLVKSGTHYYLSRLFANVVKKTSYQWTLPVWHCTYTPSKHDLFLKSKVKIYCWKVSLTMYGKCKHI